jgi:hypothetical protein
VVAKRKDDTTRVQGVGRCHCGIWVYCTKDSFGHLYAHYLARQTDTMDEIEELRLALGSLAKDYNVTQLGQFSRELDLMAGLLLDFYILKRSGRPAAKKPVFDTPGSKPLG